MNVASHVDPRFGGIVSSLPPLCHALENEGRYHAPLAAFCLPGEQANPSVHRFPHSFLPWVNDHKLRARFRTLTSDANLCHIHGIWEPHCAVASRFARSLKRPYVISAHGMLDPWALKQKSLKKKVYSALVEFKNLSSAACLRAMTQNEADQYRHFGLKNPIAVIANGVHVPSGATAEPFLERYPHLRQKTLVLFLGRLHTKKGVFPLCRAWLEVSRSFPDAHLVIGGPDSEGIASQLRTIVEAAKDSVTFTGPLTGDMIWSAYAAASVFILPSYSEGFSIAILEALGSGTPVIVTDACYFPDIPAAGAGWITAVEESDIARTLITALNSPPATLAAMGQKAANLVAAKYSWPEIATQLADLYDWMLGGPVPTSFPLL